MSSEQPTPDGCHAGAGVAGLKVLLADDTLITQAMMRLRLTRLGCEVTMAENGREAVDAFKTQPFDCILMDYHMPILDGVEATKEIRAWEETTQKKRRVYIAAFTATSQASDREVLLASGMNDILGKPMPVPELIRVLQRAAARR